MDRQERNGNQRQLPPRLTSHGRSQTKNVPLASLSPVSSNTIPLPLASPITATANSLTALSISQTSAHTAYTGRDLSKITVPRERKKSRPYSVSSAESLLVQEHGRGNRDEIHQQDQSGGLSDPETSRRNGHGSAKQVAKTFKSNEIKSPSLKPASQVRVTLHNLVSAGYLPTGTLVLFREHSALVTIKGTLIPQINESDISLYPSLQSEYETPSAWATAMVKGCRTGKVAVNGWSAIKISLQQLPEMSKMFEGQGLTEISLDVLRKRFLADVAEDDNTHAEVSSTQTNSWKGTALDRKKRKRHATTSADNFGLRITTQINTEDQKGRPGATRPRKRTMSDLSGMVSTNLLQDRRSQLEAADALFSMQDPLFSPTFDIPGRRVNKNQSSRQKGRRQKHRIPLESLARHRQDRELARQKSSSSSSCLSSLRIMRQIPLVPVAIPLDSNSSATHMEFCALCGATGQVAGFRRRSSSQSALNHNWSSTDSIEAALEDTSYEQDAMKRCFDCGECFHMDCILSGTADTLRTPSEDPWKCPRCTICSYCQKSVHELPISSTQSDTVHPHPKTSNTSHDILVLSCYKCQQFTHLQCQLKQEPSLKNLNRLSQSHEAIEWACYECRECVECGYRIQKDIKTEPKGKSPDGNPQLKKKDKDDASWTHGCALCPSCSLLEENGNICPLCCRVYQEDDYETPMIFCDGCSLWVHVACDKGLQDRDYEELGEDSRQYFCPSCIPTPIPSPAHSSTSSNGNSADRIPWRVAYGHSSDSSTVTDEDWNIRGQKKKDDILDLIKAAKEISDSESQSNSPYTSYSPLFPSTHSRTMSASLESVAEVAAAEALLTIFSGSNTPVNSTPYTSYPPSPYEPSFSGIHDRHYSAVNNAHDLPPLMRSMVFTPSSSDQESSSCSAYECQVEAGCRCRQCDDRDFAEDYFNTRPYPRRTVPYYQIGQELDIASSNFEKPGQMASTISLDMNMEPIGVEVGSENSGLGRVITKESSSVKDDSMDNRHQLFSPQYRPLQEPTMAEVIPMDVSPIGPTDARECILCHTRPDVCNGASGGWPQLGRLLPIYWTCNASKGRRSKEKDTLYFGWIHSQCALWSSGVTVDSSTGGLTGVTRAVDCNLNTVCSACGRRGASIKCKAAATRVNDSSYACAAIFHYPCLNHHRHPQSDQLQQNSSSSSNAVVMDRKLRTILCSVHYREVSTLNDLRTAAFALQSSMISSNPFAKESRLETLIAEPTNSTRSSIWIKDVTSGDNFHQAHSSVPNGGDILDTRTRNDLPYILQNLLHGSEGFRVGGLIVHSIGSFNSPGPIQFETGLANYIDLENKFKSISQQGKNESWKKYPFEVLALPLGFKCERQLLLEGNSKCSVIAEIVMHNCNEHCLLDKKMSNLSSSSSNETEERTLDSIEDDDMEISWKITIVAPRSSLNPSQNNRVFYSDSTRDVVETLLLSPSMENSDADHQPKNKFYLRSPNAFFGLDYITIRRMILSLEGAREVASRMWLRYREAQKAQDRQCVKYGYLSHNASECEQSNVDEFQEHLGLVSAARARSWSRNQLARKRTERVGVAFGQGGQLSKVDMNPENLLMPSLLQYPKLSDITPASLSLPQKESRRDSVSLEFDISADQLQGLHKEQSNNVSLYWNRRKVTTIANSPHLSSVDQPLSGTTTGTKNMDIDTTGTMDSTSVGRVNVSIPIHGDMRVYASRGFEPEEMIMEYTGEVISPAVAIRRRKFYQDRHREYYMMMCELQEVVVDATTQGGLARHIRKSDPEQGSVYAKAIYSKGSQIPKIIICAAKKIMPGDELTTRYCS
ncbi:hypothetical protein BGZ76_007407 [Entomortierella beljakovae]|nr:hypothetical protein BGZ76_007407 [Entomortierella beljakovae]